MIIINLQEIQYLGPADAQVMIVRAVGREPKKIYTYILLSGTEEKRRKDGRIRDGREGLGKRGEDEKRIRNIFTLRNRRIIEKKRKERKRQQKRHLIRMCVCERG